MFRQERFLVVIINPVKSDEQFVIIRNIAGIPELVKDSINGYTFEHTNIEELSEKMEKLFANDSLVKEFGNKSKEMCKELYSKEAYYEKIINIYSRVKR